MTSKTPFLNLTLYSTTTDGSSLFYSYINDTSGSTLLSNMSLIDISSSQISASIVGLSASIVDLQNAPSAITGSSVMSTTTGSTVKHNVSGITAGSYTKVEVDSWGHVITGSQGATSSIEITGRVGGNATDWDVYGTTNYTPASAKIQVGVVRVTWPGSVGGTSASITFPAAFSSIPMVFITRASNGNMAKGPLTAEPSSISKTAFVCLASAGTSVGNPPDAGTWSELSWLAICGG
jgi:hypothetical protein